MRHGRMAVLLSFFILFFVLCNCMVQYALAGDLQLVLHRTFLQKIMDKRFPIQVSEAYSDTWQIPNIGKSVSLGYKVDVSKPVLSIQPQYIQIDAVTNLNSVFGNRSFPTRCKFIPVYNSVSNSIEFKVVEGKIDLEFKSGGADINLGSVDLSQYLTEIKIPLQMNSFTIKEKNIKPRCENVTFKLLNDKIIVDGDIEID